MKFQLFQDFQTYIPPAFQFPEFQVTLHQNPHFQQQYCLNNGKWYRIDNSFVDSINVQYSAIDLCEATFIDHTNNADEDTYNEELFKYLPDAHLLHKYKITIGGGQGNKPIKRIGELEESCYVCQRISRNFENMVDTAVYLWQTDEDFAPKLKAQPYFCLPHYRKLLWYGQRRLGKKRQPEFAAQCAKVVESYFDELQKDVSWFCKKFDYRYDQEPWYNSKDAVERAFKFLRSDLHNK